MAHKLTWFIDEEGDLLMISTEKIFDHIIV